MPHCPVKFRYLRGRLSARPLRILDIGCGNHSPTVTGRWFPGCHYAGADIADHHLNAADHAAMDEFFLLGADGSGYDRIPDSNYDLVILNHVIEHMARSAPVVAQLCGKLAPGGFIWIAFPSLRSLSLPHSEDETLQFCDDPTHVWVPDLREIANILLANGVSVLHAGRSHEGFFTSFADMFKLGKRLARKMFTGKFSGRGLWYVLGFEDHVLGQRKTS